MRCPKAAWKNSLACYPARRGDRGNALRSTLWHFALAALNAALAVFTPFVLNTGPVPEVSGADSFTPLLLMHAANAVRAARNAGLPKRRRAACGWPGVVEVFAAFAFVLVLVLIVLLLVLEEPPQAARPRHASSAIRALPGSSGLRM